MSFQSARANWRLALLSVAGAIIGLLTPPPVATSVSQELIALFGLLLAGALPTMILTATILRAGAFSPKRVGEYGAALERQLSFWFALFIWAMGACVAVMLAKAMWDDRNPYVLWWPEALTSRLPFDVPIVEITRLANIMLGICAAQVVYRLFPMLNGLKSLLRLNSLIATEEAVAKAKAQSASGAVQIKAIQPPPGNGSVVDD
ncbi:hypothetical protein [Phenylobacterium sp.]|jgi:hypothetical protein|uniref:hypothetical protein n=1 Tax=Phenylobacterium sp. TaxID=1871053 RepID=UPI0037C9511A